MPNILTQLPRCGLFFLPFLRVFNLLRFGHRIRIGKRRHRRAANTHDDIPENVPTRAATAIRPRPGQVGRPAAVAPVILETIQGLLAVPTPLRAVAGMAFKGLLKNLLPLHCTLSRKRDFTTKIDFLARLIFRKDLCEGFDVVDQLPHLLIGEKPAPPRHRGTMQAVTNTAEYVLVRRQNVAILGLMTSTKLVRPGGKIPRPRKHVFGCSALTIAFGTVAMGAAFIVQHLAGGQIGFRRFRPGLRTQRRHIDTPGKHSYDSTEHQSPRYLPEHRATLPTPSLLSVHHHGPHHPRSAARAEWHHTGTR